VVNSAAVSEVQAVSATPTMHRSYSLKTDPFKTLLAMAM
jgi:hypothetical protein